MNAPAPTPKLPSRRTRSLRRIVSVVLALGAVVSPAQGQDAAAALSPSRSPVPGAQADSTASGGVSPGGAFLRAVLLPGWGHVSIGSYNRAGFYFAVESTAAWMLVKTIRRFHEAEDRLAFQERIVRAELARELAAEGVDDPAELETRLQEDSRLEDVRGLVEARRGQREDWLALGAFLLLISGADAFVSAHLADFPAPLTVQGQPTPQGGLEVAVSVPLPGG